MKSLFKYIFLLLFVALSAYQIKAQDVHYSQMYSTPLYVNPAFTGNHECDFRAGVNYRQQAASFTIPFETYTAWGDTRFSPEFLKRRGWFGLGAHLYHDNAGNGDLKKVQAMLFTAYSQGFNSDNSMYGSLGVGLGVTNRSVNKNAFIYGDQWVDADLAFNGSSDDPTKITHPSIYYFDFNIGLSFHQIVNEKWMYEVGGSISHVNTPKESFYDDPIPGKNGANIPNNNRVGRKYIGHATFRYILSEQFLIKPEVYYIAHEGMQETVFGANLVFNAIQLKLHGGLWHRLGRDIIPVLGVEYNDFTLLFSYDLNVSSQRVASQYKGGFEFSLVKRFCYSTRRSTKREPCKFLEF